MTKDILRELFEAEALDRQDVLYILSRYSGCEDVFIWCVSSRTLTYSEIKNALYTNRWSQDTLDLVFTYVIIDLSNVTEEQYKDYFDIIDFVTTHHSNMH